MKKILLILTLCMMTVGVAKASQWVSVDTNSSKYQLFVDKDFIRTEDSDTVYYPLLVKEAGKTPIVLYIDANYAKNKAAVLSMEDYDADNYNPFLIFANYRGFLKPVLPNTVIDYSYQYIACRYSNSKNAQAICSNRNRLNMNADDAEFTMLPVRNANNDKAKMMIKEEIKGNWKVPSQGKNTDAKVHIAIGPKGSLEGYTFIKSTGVEAADRAIISAIELTAPFRYLENTSMSVYFKADSVFKDVR